MRQIDVPPAVRAQPIIFNLLGDYVHPRGETVWTSGLLDLLSRLGVGERAARSALSRMKLKGWLKASRSGRRSAYTLTPKTRALLDEGSRRLFGPRPTQWDGSWHLVVYSLPQTRRALRRQLRTRLSWLGYGMLLPGTMVAAFPKHEEVTQLFRELGVGRYVHFFSRSRLETADGNEIVSRCWDLPGLNRRYARFIRRYQPSHEWFLERCRSSDGLPPEESFVHRFWITYEFSSFPREDPDLPPELLPPDWVGGQAAELLRSYRQLLKEAAEGFADSTMQVEQAV
jgi:phenylacetic acid degradation operon negative regulatory protein